MGHEKYSIPHTLVLGFVAWGVTSNLCGIGPAERSWDRVKQVKDGKRCHLSAKSTEREPSCLFLQKYHRHKFNVTAWKSWMQRDAMQCLEMTISILICNSRALVLTWGRWRNRQSSVFFSHGWKIGKRNHKRKTTLLLRRSCLQNIKVLSSVIPTQGNHFYLGTKYGVKPGER